MNKTISFTYMFSICCFMVLLFINHFSFDFLTNVPVLLSFDKGSTRLFSVNYFALMGAVVLIYAFVALLSLNIFGTGLSDEAIATLRRIATMILIFALLSPFYTSVFEYCGVIGTILSYIVDIVFIIVQVRGFNEETA